mmetsp:Transcript_130268/g.324808  ORF Transcript_130268/g.324808 Transcript_130268/m.324808 type:complete len:219 (-) Transcript_130268:157-813(-)
MVRAPRRRPSAAVAAGRRRRRRDSVEVREALQHAARGDEQRCEDLRPPELLQPGHARDDHDDKHIRGHDHRPRGDSQHEQRLVLRPERQALHNPHRHESHHVVFGLRRGSVLPKRWLLPVLLWRAPWRCGSWRILLLAVPGRGSGVGDRVGRQRPGLHHPHPALPQQHQEVDQDRCPDIGHQSEGQRIRKPHDTQTRNQWAGQRRLHEHGHPHSATPP